MAALNPKLLVCHWNSRSVRNKKLQLEQLLTSRDIDVCLLSETCLSDTDSFKINGYKI